MELQVNWLAVLVAALVHFVLGWAWYTFLFPKPWSKELGYDKLSKKEKQKGMKEFPKALAINFGILLVTAYVLTHIIVFSEKFYGTSGLKTGLMSGFWIWLGFYATTAVNSVIWEGRSWKLYGINMGYSLLGLLLMGGILAVWR